MSGNYKFNVDWWDLVSNNFIEGPGFMKKFIGVPTKAIQIGCFEGRGTVWMLDHVLTHRDSKLIDIDPFYSETDLAGANFDTVKSLYYHNLKECANANNFPRHQIIVGKSADILPTLEKNSFDLIYVDGSHMRDDVWLDAIYSHELLKSGGRMFFDDYEWCTDNPNVNRESIPHDAIAKFLEEYKTQYKIIDIHYQVVIEKL